MLKDKLEALENTKASRRTVLKGLLVGLGAGVLVQVKGGVAAFAQGQVDPIKTEKAKSEKGKGEKAIKGENSIKDEKAIKGEKNKGESKGFREDDDKKKNDKKKTEEPKQQRKK